MKVLSEYTVLIQNRARVKTMNVCGAKGLTFFLHFQEYTVLTHIRVHVLRLKTKLKGHVALDRSSWSIKSI